MFFTENFRIGLTLLNKSNYISNKGLLSLLEDVAEMHSSSVGYGITDICKTNFSWALLNWKVEIISRPKYGEIITIKTWSRYNTKLYCYRDFEIFDSNGNLVAIASSKWVLIDVSKGKISKIEDELISKYKSENKSVFDIIELPKLEDLDSYSNYINYSIRKSDIDINNHVNNLCYLDIATEILPDELSNFNECNNFEIMFKKQIKLDDKIVVHYNFSDEVHNVTVKGINDNIVHCIMKFW